MLLIWCLYPVGPSSCCFVPFCLFDAWLVFFTQANEQEHAKLLEDKHSKASAQELAWTLHSSKSYNY